MRHLLLALMIALLPVRGWVGNAMAIDMAAQQVVMAYGTVNTMTESAAMNADASMPSDCPMHAQASAPADNTGEDSTTGFHCNGCNTCELCLTLASFTWTELPAATFTPRAEPSTHGTRFSSADSVSGLKPPIS